MGPNGAGKSTLLKLLIRAEVATSGIVIVAGHDLRQLPEPRVPGYRQQIGIVFQDIRLFPEKTVFENVAFSLQVCASPPARTRDLVMEALDLVGLSNHARRFPAQISAGSSSGRHRAGHRALAAAADRGRADRQPPPDASWEIMQLLGEINRRGVTVVVATHDSAVVDRTKRRVVELTEGRWCVTSATAASRPTAPATARRPARPTGSPTARRLARRRGCPTAPHGAPAGASNGSAEHAAEPGSTLYPLLPPSGPSVLGRTTGQLGADSGLYPALAGADRPSL